MPLDLKIPILADCHVLLQVAYLRCIDFHLEVLLDGDVAAGADDGRHEGLALAGQGLADRHLREQRLQLG